MSETDNIRKRAELLVKRLWDILGSDAYVSVFMVAEAHGCKYGGETFGAELTALSDALGITPPEPERWIGIDEVLRGRASE